MILCGCGDDDLLCGALSSQMQRCSLLIQEDSGGLAHILNSVLTPCDILRVLLVEHADLLAIDDDVLLVVGDLSGPLSMDGIVLELKSSTKEE